MATPSTVHSFLSPQKVVPFEGFNAEGYRDLKRIGIVFDTAMVKEMMKHPASVAAMDSLQPTITTGSVTTPVQFLQFWLPGFTRVITAARKADNIMGIMNAGAWEDEQIVQGVMENTGLAIPYGDLTNVPQASWNTNFNIRTVIRFEEGMRVTPLESARAARMNVNSAAEKRISCARNLEIERNQVAFFGFNSGLNNTYGFLNDPGLLAYTQVAAGIAGRPWSVKTFLEIQRDLLTALQTLRTQSQDTIDPEDIDITLAVATGSVDYLATTSDFGVSVRDWLKNAYPRVRVTSAPQLNNANAGANAFYLFADKIEDDSTDGGATWLQVVPAKFNVLGVQQLSKGYEEDYANATAGAMCKRPWAVTRWYGI